MFWSRHGGRRPRRPYLLAAGMDPQGRGFPPPGPDGGEPHAAHHAAGFDVGALASHGLWNAAAAQPVVLLASLLTLAMLAPSTAISRRRSPGFVAAAAAMVPVTAALMVVVPTVFSATAPTASASSTGGCATAPVRSFNVSAINVDITLNRFGDHDPFGFMFVQNE